MATGLKLLLSNIIEKRNFLYKAIMAGGIDPNDPDNPVDNKDHMFMAFFKDKLAAIINNKWCKIIIIIAFASYLAGACYGVTQIKEGLERRKLSREDSYSVEFFDREDDYYREFPYRMQVSLSSTFYTLKTANPINSFTGYHCRSSELLRSRNTRTNREFDKHFRAHLICNLFIIY